MDPVLSYEIVYNAIADGEQRAREYGIKPFEDGFYKVYNSGLIEGNVIGTCKTANDPLDIAEWIKVDGLLKPSEGFDRHIGSMMVRNPLYQIALQEEKDKIIHDN